VSCWTILFRFLAIALTKVLLVQSPHPFLSWDLQRRLSGHSSRRIARVTPPIPRTALGYPIRKRHPEGPWTAFFIPKTFPKRDPPQPNHFYPSQKKRYEEARLPPLSSYPFLKRTSFLCQYSLGPLLFHPTPTGSCLGCLRPYLSEGVQHLSPRFL